MSINKVLLPSVKFLIILLAWIASMPVSSAQNMVPNPSLEDYTTCPTYVGLGGPLEAFPWSSPFGSSDYFNACSTFPCCGVPNNSLGYQYAHEGVAMGGLFTMKAQSFYREFMQVPLVDTLEAGLCYYVSFWINLSNEACAANRIGALFTADPDDIAMGSIPQIDWSGQFFDDTLHWVNIFGYFFANGDEAFMTIGNFYSDLDTELQQPCDSWFGKAYYYIDDVSVELVPTDFVDIDLAGPVTACDSFTIDMPDPNYQYHWSTGQQGQSITVYTSGTYSVTASKGCSEDIAEIEVTILYPQEVELGDDIILCPGDEVEIFLDPDAGEYTWQDGSNNAHYIITTPGFYQVTLEDECATSIDWMIVGAMDIPPPFTLGEDTVLCDGDVFNINIDPSYGEFLWQDNSISSSYEINTPGTYSLTISNICGEQTDELVVDGAIYPELSLGDDILLCNTDVLYIEFDPAMGFYVWQDGSTDHYHTISTAGTYSVTVSNSCGTISDAIVVDHLNTPVFDLGPDMIGCPSDTFVLSIGNHEGQVFWQDNSTDSTYMVTTSGIFAVTVTNACGTNIDSVTANFTTEVNAPDLGPDVTLCPGEQVQLDVNTPGAQYLWNDMSTADTLIVSAAGIYFVRVYNACSSYSDTIVVSVDSNPPIVELPADFFLCQGQSTVLDAIVSGASYLWNDGTTQQQLTVTGPGTYAVTVSNSCGTSVDSILISEGEALPFIQLGPDTSLCHGDTIVIIPTYDHVNNLIWQDGSTAAQFEAIMPGVISVKAGNSCGDAYDTMNISLLPAVPDLDLGPDVLLCPDDTVVLSIAISDVDIIWSDGSTTNDLIVFDSAIVFATISNRCGVSNDTIQVRPLPGIPLPDIGDDQTICPGESVILSADIPGVNYLWQDGSTNSSFTTNQGGTYYLTISNSCGAATDSITLTESTEGPQVDLGPDVQGCDGQSVTIDAGISGVQYLWQDGSTLDAFVTTVPGIYVLNVSNACGVDIDSISVDFLSIPGTIDLGPDTSICEGKTFLISVQPEPGVTIEWQDQSAGNNYLVSTSGIYSVMAANLCGIVTDSIQILYEAEPDPFTLGPDITLCDGDSVTLTAPVTNFDLIWQDGGHEQFVEVREEGTYKLVVRNVCGVQSDSVVVDINHDLPVIQFEPEILWCPGEMFTLNAQQPFDAIYSWNTGATTSSIVVNVPGTFWVDVSTICFQANDQTTVTPDENCQDSVVFYIPNVFTPNGDQANDVFTVFTNITDRIISMEGNIYDRWGNQVFYSNEIPFSWDGYFKKERMMPGVYVYVITIRYFGLTGEEAKTIKGDVTLIR